MLVPMTTNPFSLCQSCLAKVMLDTMAFIFIRYNLSKGISFSEGSLDNDNEIDVYKKGLDS